MSERWVLSHQAVIWVRTRSLPGTGSRMTTSKALTRSVATRRRWGVGGVVAWAVSLAGGA